MRYSQCDVSKLFVVPTPVGNLSDITLRAIEVLKSVDLILAEDTRTSGVLLKHYGITTKMKAHHAFNEHQAVEHIGREILSGRQIALITDAGTPGISDPGYLLIHHCIQQGIVVETLPGATAFVPALVSSGLPISEFTFIGFLPVKKGRETKLKQLCNETRTLVIYESPHRIVKTLEQLQIFCGDRRVSVSREISKKFEETVRGTLGEVALHFTQHAPKGEFVIVLAGAPDKPLKKQKDNPAD